MMFMLQSHDLTVTDKSGTTLTVDLLAQKMLQSAAARAGGTLTIEQIATVREIQKMATTLTREKAAELFCHTKLKKPNKGNMLFDPTFPREKTYRAAIAMYTNGRDPNRQKEWMEGFDPDILYITTGRLLGGVTENKADTIKDLKEKYKKSPELTFDIFPIVLTFGNVAMTFVNNKTPNGPAFVLAGLTFFKATKVTNPDSTDKELVRAICNVDTYSSDDALGAILGNYWKSFVNWAGRISICG